MPKKTRVYTLAKEYGVTSKEFVDTVRAAGVACKGYMSTLSDDEVSQVRAHVAKQTGRSPQTPSSQGTAAARNPTGVVRRRASATRRSKDVEQPASSSSTTSTEKPTQPARSPAASTPVKTSGPVVRSRTQAPTPSSSSPTPPAQREAATPSKGAGATQASSESTSGAPKTAARKRLEALAAKPSVSPVHAPVKGDQTPAPVQASPEPSNDDASAPANEGGVIRNADGVIVGTRRKRAEPTILGYVKLDRPRKRQKVVVEQASEERDRRGRASQRKARVERTLSTSRRRKKSSVRRGAPSGPKRSNTKEMSEAKRRVRVDGTIRVSDLAHAMSEKAGRILKSLWKLGLRGVTLNHTIDHETASVVAEEFGYQVENVGFEEADVIESTKVDDQGEPRAPVVTVMGHVDHGKTSLLDVIRASRVADAEAGGITQHIGAYRVGTAKGDVVFLDTPGHEAFTSMRSRGAHMTDVVVLVVAADDGIMPTTIEAIEHARQADVPIVVAVNKIDKPEANLGRVKQQLMEYKLVGEEFGGETIIAPVSAKTGEGIEALLESLALQAEMLELKAPADGPAAGVVVEVRVDKGRGAVATVLVQAGTLRKGDIVVVGESRGKVRDLRDDAGKRIKKAGPSTPVEVVGLDGLPSAGDTLHGVENDKAAKQLVEYRRERRLRTASNTNVVSIEEFLKRKKTPILRIVLKADVDGSVGALKEALQGLSTSKVRVDVPSVGVGDVSESDVKMAAASDAIIVGFNVSVGSRARSMADAEEIEVYDFSVIYEALERVQELMLDLLEPIYEENEQGVAEVRATFTVPKIGTVAGCRVVKGSIERSSLVRVRRGDEIVHTGRIASLKVHKDDVAKVGEDRECGLVVEGFNDFQGGEVIEVYELQAVQPSL